jgi:hypothetical protein
MHLLRWRTRAALLLTVLFAVLGTSTALAHEGRDVGDYNFIVGFINEPAVEGMLNGVSVRITSLIVEGTDDHDHDAHDHAEAEATEDHAASNAVAGLTTLQVEVTHVASSVSQVMDLNEAWNSPGQYKSEFIPTSPGSYNFRFFGDIDGQAIDESFESSNTTFDEVTPATEIQFPVQLSAPRETENAARGALDTANDAAIDASDASSSASTATLLGIIALILGLAGLVLGGLAFQRSGKKA